MLLMLSGCSLIPGITVDHNAADDWYPEGVDVDGGPQPRLVPVTPQLILEQQRERIDQSGLLELIEDQPAESREYRVGRRDILNVVVWEHPELSNPMGRLENIEQTGRLVRSDGTIFFPYVGKVNVAGLTAEQIREKIQRGLTPYIESPQVDVRVVSHRSTQVYVTGEVAEPGIFPLTDKPLTIMDAINLAGGFGEHADRREAVLTRDGRQYPVDIHALYSRGSNNLALRDGDILHVPDNNANKVFVMGQVQEQRAVLMDKGRLTLAEAVSEASGFNLGRADTGAVFVIRGQLRTDEQTGESVILPTFYHLDARHAAALLLADRFELHPRDVVYVSSTGLVRWNRVMEQILPTITFLFQTDRLIFNR